MPAAIVGRSSAALRRSFTFPSCARRALNPFSTIDSYAKPMSVPVGLV